MSSTGITICGDACKKPAFPLPPELRIKVYEQLLIQPNHSFKPDGSTCYRKNHIFTDILRTCRNFYEEALPILYGKNTLLFYDFYFGEPVLSFPEGHFALIKRAEVNISPFLHSSAEKMGAFFMALGTPVVKLVDLLIRTTLLGDHPIVAGLFSLKAVQKLVIQMEDEARFGPDVANALREAFLMEGTADGRTITIEHVCSFPHKLLEEEETCPHCDHTLEDLVNGTVNWEYKDDRLTRRAVEKYNSLSRKLKKGEQRKAKSVTGKATKAKEPQTEAAATNHKYHNQTD